MLVQGAVILVLMIVVGLLNHRARRADFEGFCRRAMTRRVRVPLERPVEDARKES